MPRLIPHSRSTAALSSTAASAMRDVRRSLASRHSRSTKSLSPHLKGLMRNSTTGSNEQLVIEAQQVSSRGRPGKLLLDDYARGFAEPREAIGLAECAADGSGKRRGVAWRDQPSVDARSYFVG